MRGKLPSPRQIRKGALYGVGLVIALGALFLIQYFLGGAGLESPRFNLQAVLLAVMTLINIILILVLSIVYLRYLAKHFFEKKGRRFFASVKAKLIVAFMFLAIVPTALFVLLSFEIINKSVNQWFSAPAEGILRNSEVLAQRYYESAVNDTKQLLDDFLKRKTSAENATHELATFRRERHLDAVVLLGANGRTRFSEANSSQDEPLFQADNIHLVMQNASPGKISHFVDNRPNEDIVMCFTPSPWSKEEILVFIKRIHGSIAYQSFLIVEASHQYFQLKNQVELIRLNYFFIVGIAGMVLLFVFAWFGIFISKKITIPISALLEGSQRIATGDLSSLIQCPANDEFEVLINSFNSMMEELKRNRAAIEAANENLTQTNRELQRRNAFIETVMDAIATGVVSIDQDHVITISNTAASHLLKQRKIQDGRTQLQEMLPEEQYEELLKLLIETEFQPRVSREIIFKTGKRTLHFAVTAARITDEENRSGGYVIVFDDVTDLIRTEKAAAWQEVAQRLAHEIKNPLTPIQLSMERIRRQFQKISRSPVFPKTEEVLRFGAILDEALQTAESEARNLKYLVEEFSQFARLPVPTLKLMDLNALVEEVASRYRQVQSGLTIIAKLEPELPTIYADAELIRRVLVNLIDNSIDSIHENHSAGEIVLETRLDQHSSSVLLSVVDNGKGIADDVLENMFLPYFSTKDTGMGLGLTIIKKILDDHDAGIRVESISPQGARFIVEFRRAKTIDSDPA